MDQTLIEINDIALRIYRAGAELVSDPGVAYVENHVAVFGEVARQKLRSNPQGGYDKYWNQLDEVPLAKPPRGLRHHADLAYQHLQVLTSKYGPLGEVWFLVPSDYNREKLSLLLGIAAALNISVTGFIDSAVANVAACEVNSQTVEFLDLGLHRTCISRILTEGDARFESYQTLERSGKKHLDDTVLTWIADCFLDQARFDPLHDAASEQLMVNQLDDWLADLRSNAHINVGLAHHGRTHEVSLSRSELIRKLGPAFDALTAPLNSTAAIILSRHFSIYPPELLTRFKPLIANDVAPFEAAISALPHFAASSDEVRLCRSLPPNVSRRDNHHA